MTDRYQRLDSGFFRIHDVDARETARGLLTGDRAQDERSVALLLATLNAVSSLVGPREVMRRTVDMLVALTGADRGLLLLLDEAGELVLHEGRTLECQDVDREEPYSHSVPRQALAEGRGVCIVDTLEGTERILGASVTDLALRTIMCAPLRMRDAPIGVMYVDSKLAIREFTAADVALFEALCQQVAVILENSRLNEGMIEAERLASLGQMTSMILHDLASPMTVVDHHAAQLQRGERAGADVVAAAREIQGASKRIRALLESARDYARGGASLQMASEPIALHLQLWLGQRHQELLDWGVALALDLQYDGPVELEARRVERVVTNLVNNALEAMPDGGQLRVSLVARGDEVELIVADTGKGIPEAEQQRLFEPFVTLGKVGGTGLGLAIVKQIVESHGGTVALTSVEGRGTTVTVRLPLIQPRP